MLINLLIQNFVISLMRVADMTCVVYLLSGSIRADSSHCLYRQSILENTIQVGLVYVAYIQLRVH